MKPYAVTLAGTLVASAFLPTLAWSQSDVVVKRNTEVAAFSEGRIASSYWTPERLKAAKPLPLPKAQWGSTVEQDSRSLSTQGGLQSSEAGAPSIQAPPDRERLFAPDDAPQALPQGGRLGSALGAQPFDEGSFRTPYTTSRVENGYSVLESTYAWRTVGKLYFTIAGQPYQCSASVISRRIIATAGHCVHEGNNSPTGWHANFLFIPAFDSGAAPFQTWTWDAAITTSTWYGGGGVPNAADYAMIQLRDRALTTGGAVRRIGDVTGWLGWRTGSLAHNHTTKLGYPCNFASCNKMIQTTSANFRTVSPNNVEYGSDQRGGSSGGPWVQNFNASCPAEGCGTNPGWNQVVGVTSYGYIDTAPRVQGASILDSRWVSIWNSICGFRAGNCS